MGASTRTSHAKAPSEIGTDYVALAGKAIRQKIPVDHKDHDDILSDTVLALFEKSAETWRPGQVYRYALQCAHVRQHHAEIAMDDNPAWKISTRSPALQEIAYDAGIASRLLAALPNKDREVLEILADGGDVLDVATELHMSARNALTAIRRARHHAERVDPL